MGDLSRRQILSMAALTPVAALLPSALAGAARAGASQPMSPARARIQRQHLPNVPLITQDGEQVHFYDDLVKGKIVTVNFFYAKCDELCPLVIGNLVKVQKLLHEEVSQDIHMYSITLKPEEDSPSVIKDYMQEHGVKPGWTFLTGKPADVETLRRGLGFSYPDPAVDKDKTQHIGNVRFGNEPLMLWSACPGMAHAKWVAETISWMVRPETNRVQQTP
jgi:protein SCO1/2